MSAAVTRRPSSLASSRSHPAWSYHKAWPICCSLISGFAIVIALARRPRDGRRVLTGIQTEAGAVHALRSGPRAYPIARA